eukprot:TRINITY_DN6716_c0_g1_i3.p1 TRINITY_DN6716_c0_g1~~TRINITY_DN6716_c0_g1_i3.p1  ORF type:complete len:324 (-),score=48.05 TRINITY_DN6716_c0_g1_i3:151-1122(-)
MKCWIDTDAGIDDAIGLMIAMSCKDVEIVGISCVHGNVGVDQVVQNVCRVLTLFNRSDIPVYKGSFEPSLSQTIEAGHIHGEDGLGDKPDLHPKYDEIDRSLYKVHVHAVNALIEAAKERHKEIVLITLGPLTNIAMACKFDSQFTSRFQKVLVMGGSESVGNITSHAEYNFHADPEAAHIVFQKFERITLVTWDCCVNHALDPPFLDDLFKNAADKLKLDFVEGITQNLRKLSIQFYGGFVQCDPLAVIVALHPELILKSQTKDCAVELQGFRTRGMSILDNRQFRQLSNRSDEDILKSGNSVIVQQIDMVGVKQLFRQMLE